MNYQTFIAGDDETLLLIPGVERGKYGNEVENVTSIKITQTKTPRLFNFMPNFKRRVN